MSQFSKITSSKQALRKKYANSNIYWELHQIDLLVSAKNLYR